MATLDEAFALAEVYAAGTDEVLTFNPDTREIIVPRSEAIFGVESDQTTERKYFKGPRYVGNGLDLAGCFLRVNFRNANGEVDAYLVKDLAATADAITFSWELSKKVTLYRGEVQFVVCACLPTGTSHVPEWNTTIGTGKVLEGLEPDTSNLEAETSDILTQLITLVDRQSAAVEATGAEQIREVQAAGADATSAAKAEIEAQAAVSLASIPADYTALAGTVEKLHRDRAPGIVCALEGKAVQAADASDDPLHGLRVFGRSVQEGTPTLAAPVPIVSLPAPTVGVYGKNLCPPSAFDTMASSGKTSNTYDPVAHSITMNDDPVSTTGRYCAPHRYFVAGQAYVMSFDLRGTTGRRVKCGWDIGSLNITLTAEYKRYSIAVVATRANEPVIFYSKAAVDGGLLAGEFMQFANVQIEVGETATDYEPYIEAQTVQLSAPNGLPGIPVASGGNYTDENGQQWVADEVDLARGVYVQRVALEELNNATNYANRCLYCRLGKGRSKYDNVFISSHAAVGLAFANGATGAYNSCVMGPSNLPETVTDLTSGQAWLDQLKAAGAPVVVGYVLTTPVETELTAQELAAWQAIHSNKPTTTVVNDAGAWMAVEYVADTKTYIDRKIAELVSAKA